MSALCLGAGIVTLTGCASTRHEPPITDAVSMGAVSVEGQQESDDAKVAQSSVDTSRKPFQEVVPGTTYMMTFVPIPGGTLVDDGESIKIDPFYMLSTEVTWDAYDVFLYERDKEQNLTNESVDAVTRPSKPYIPPDRGFGHEGYPAIGISFESAQAFCAWLSAHTGKRYRLPTAHEWEHAAMAGTSTAFYWGDDVSQIDAHVWHDGNADMQTQAVRQKAPNPWGLYDVFGNAAEWVVDTDPEAKPYIRGGHYMNVPSAFDREMKQYREPSWSARDPQVPKSRWWLTDGSFVGFRVVYDPTPEAGSAMDAPGATPAKGVDVGREK